MNAVVVKSAGRDGRYVVLERSSGCYVVAGYIGRRKIRRIVLGEAAALAEFAAVVAKYHLDAPSVARPKTSRSVVLHPANMRLVRIAYGVDCGVIQVDLETLAGVWFVRSYRDGVLLRGGQYDDEIPALLEWRRRCAAVDADEVDVLLKKHGPEQDEQDVF